MCRESGFIHSLHGRLPMFIALYGQEFSARTARLSTPR